MNVLFILKAITWSWDGCMANLTWPILVVSDETSETCMCEMCSLISTGSTMILKWSWYTKLVHRCSVCDHPAQMFFTSKFNYLLFVSQPQPIKLNLGEQIGGGILIANHLDQSLWWADQKLWSPVRSYLLHSFLQVSMVWIHQPFDYQ
jgi:hypothetical protein